MDGWMDGWVGGWTERQTEIEIWKLYDVPQGSVFDTLFFWFCFFLSPVLTLYFAFDAYF